MSDNVLLPTVYNNLSDTVLLATVYNGKSDNTLLPTLLVHQASQAYNFNAC